LDRVRRSVTTQIYVAPKRQTLTEYIQHEWLPAVKGNLEESTWASYSRYLTLHVTTRIGGVQIQRLDPGLLNRLYADLLVDGRLDGIDGLSPRTVRYIATILHRALKDAVAWNRLVRNPADAARPPRARDAKAPAMQTWTAAELEEFLRRCGAYRYTPAWMFLATTGCRRGETIGLCWTDVDLENARVSIGRAITAIDHKVKIGARTKTARARVIEIDSRTVVSLKACRVRQAEGAAADGRRLRGS
jgi:integrase